MSDERRLTFAEVDERAGRLASALIEAGAGDGERVALLALNEPEYFEIQVAAQARGGDPRAAQPPPRRARAAGDPSRL